MYVWNINALSTDLKNNRIEIHTSLLYFFMCFFLLITRLNPFTFLPYIYHATFSYIKNYLEAEAYPASFTITVFSNNKEYPLAMLTLTVAGIIILLLSTQQSLFEDLKTIWCLSIPLFIRIVIITGVIFILNLALLALFFGPQLDALRQSTEISLANPTSLLPHSIIKAGWQTAQKYVTAQTLFNQITIISYYTYIASYVGALLSTCWYFIRLKQFISSCKTK